MPHGARSSTCPERPSSTARTAARRVPVCHSGVPWCPPRTQHRSTAWPRYSVEIRRGRRPRPDPSAIASAAVPNAPGASVRRRHLWNGANGGSVVIGEEVRRTTTCGVRLAPDRPTDQPLQKPWPRIPERVPNGAPGRPEPAVGNALGARLCTRGNSMDLEEVADSSALCLQEDAARTVLAASRSDRPMSFST